MSKKENNDFSKWPSIKDGKAPKATPVKYDPHMGIFAPQIKQVKRKQPKNNRRIG